jgi:hypothetical protein
MKNQPITLKIVLLASCCLLLCLLSCRDTGPVIGFGSLLDEMTDLERLTRVPDPPYRVVQYSSYDRRSRTPADTTWFCNEDGFGGEPVPGFEKVLAEPDSGGTGEYLICDVRSPGVIQRLWTAAISGRIRLYLDEADQPVYEGDALEFFRNPLAKFAGPYDSVRFARLFRQFDATYLPIPFARRCRIEWIGKIADPHFYHVGLRIYQQGTRVEPFSAGILNRYADKLEGINRILNNPELMDPSEQMALQTADVAIGPLSGAGLCQLKGPGAIGFFKVKIRARNLEAALRQTVLAIWFDDAAVPQVQSPPGDFFGAAPGLNPFNSLPFTVNTDSTLVCRFVMPFKKSARIEIRNFSGDTVFITSRVRTVPFAWKDGESMHFRTQWSIDRNLTARNTDGRAVDVSYLEARGTGRIAGAAAYLYNPSPVPTSWGNWWGEGDEKIFIDRDTFPSFFGTGSEDYFNYSWSSPRIFSYPYCGQPRNDGPDNRGYVANFRWHIADDIPFEEQIRFLMELRHHGVVPGFDYGRIVYYYAIPGITPDHTEILPKDIGEIPYPPWSPVAYLGSDGYTFIQAEQLAEKTGNLWVDKGTIWAEGQVLTWRPKRETEKLRLNIRLERDQVKTRIGFTLAHSPYGGTIRFELNGRPVKIDDREAISLASPHRTVLENHFTELIDLKPGNNEMTIDMSGADGAGKAQIDFVWLRK